MSARPRTTTRRKRATPIIMKAFGGAILAAVLFYAGWLVTTEVQSFKSLRAIAPTASTTPVATPAVVAPAPTDPYASTYATGSEVVIDGNTVDIALSTTTTEIDQGLQDRPTLGANDGMLFVFNKASIYQFWMPNMSFSLDMIWIGSDNKIVHISRNAPPLLDPSKPVWFKPSSPAQYVLEVNANYAATHNIRIGDAVQFVSSPL